MKYLSSHQLKSLAIFVFTLFALGILTTSFAPSVFADWLIDRTGALVQIDGSILGDDDQVEVEDRDEEEKETTNEQREQVREAEKQRIEKSRETLKNQIELRSKIREKTGQKSEFELRSEDGRLKVKQEIRNLDGSIKRKSELEIREGESLHLEQEDGQTAEVMVVDNDQIELIKNKIRTKSDFNLNINEKNNLSVTLPSGNVRTISLPDQALEKLIENGVLTPSAEGEEPGSYELTANANGEPIYQAEGQVEKRLFGLPFLKLKFKQKLEIAAGDSEDGSVKAGDILESTSQEQSGWRRFLERLSVNN